MKAKKVTKKKGGKRAKKRIKTPAPRAKRSVKKVVKPARRHLSAAKKVSGLSICERLAHLLTRTSIVIYAAKPTGDYAATFVSDNIKRMTGYTFRPFINRPGFWFDHVHPDDQERVLDEVERVFENDYHEYEYRFRHKKGHYIWVRDEMRVIRGPKGKPKEIVGYWTDITKRKELEIMSLKQAEIVSEFMESASEGFALLDSKFNIVGVNRYLLDRFGARKEDVLGMNYLDISPVAYESGRYEEYLEILETGRPRYYADLVLPPAYGERHVSAHVFRVGDCLGLIIKEVTDEIMRQNELEESEAHFQSLFNSTNAGVVFQDPDGVVLRVNGKACEMLDISESDFVGSRLVDVCGDLVDERGAKLGIDDYPTTKALRICKPVLNVTVGMPAEETGGIRWFLVNAEPVLDRESGGVDEVLCYFVDITEQKYVEDQLVESEERYRQIFENCPIGIGISDMDGRVLTANNAMQRITGYSLAEFKKITLADTFESAEERDRMLAMLDEKGQVTDYRIRLLRRDGTPYDAVLNISRIEVGGKTYHHTMCDVVEP
ncbi:MAG: PAS domain S-box protein [candidate division WOR-3 bacterium]|nr:MAG: PAS domain S-box protein [candidate division WOR-3 bacterium]